jgi:outer membrane immunogenic protein
MSRVFLAGVAASALIPSAAFAAGPMDWNRTYFGAQIGGGGMNSDWSIDDGYFGQQATSLSDQGLVGGLFVGHDFQVGGLVIGAEADFNFMDLSDSFSWIDGPEGLTVRTSVKNVGSVRARLGLPWQNLLVYATAGAAFGSVDASYDLNTIYRLASGSNSLSPGYVVGGGVEARVGGHMTLRAQALYYDFGSTSFNNVDGYGSDYHADANAWVATVGTAWEW